MKKYTTSIWKRLLFAIVALGLYVPVAMGQDTIIMPRTGGLSVEIQPCKEYIILDPGGTGDYPEGCNSALFLWTTTGASFSIEGDYTVTALQPTLADRLTFYAQAYIFDGDILQSVSGESKLAGTYPDETNPASYNPHVFGSTTVSGHIGVTVYSGFAAIRFKSASGQAGAEGFALRVKADEGGNPSADHLQVSDITATSARLSWRGLTTGGRWTLRYGVDGYYNKTANPTSNSIVLRNLEPNKTYNFVLSNSQDDPRGEDRGCTSPMGTFHTQARLSDGGCIDFMDLDGDYAQCFSGNYNDAKVKEGKEDYGEDIMESRHTVMTTRGTDPRASNETQQLKTIPDGESSSIRLGNWEVGAQSECVTYQYTVDTNQFDLIVLKYAVVLQEPNHDFLLQPMFFLSIADEEGNEIDTSCYTAHFVPGANTSDWNVGSQPNILWKDWSTIGIDLAPLHGRTVFINLTTRDCLEAAHYGYAYYVMHCGHKEARALTCGESIENTFTMPEGFSYRWHKEGETATLASSRELHVTERGTYLCDLSFLGSNSDRCSFTMRAVAGPHYPQADFALGERSFDSCNQRIVLKNNSRITLDAAHRRLSTDDVGLTYKWVIDGDTIDGDLSYFNFSEGRHCVSLIASISAEGCSDSKTISLYADGTCSVDESCTIDICDEITPFVLYGQRITRQGMYNLDSANHVRRVTVNLRHSDIKHRKDTVVENDLATYQFNGARFTTDVDTVLFHLSTVYGCDSILRLTLTVCHNSDTAFTQEVCDNQWPFVHDGQSFYNADTRTYTIANHCGGDSTITLTVVSRPTYRADRNDTLCDNQNYQGVSTEGHHEVRMRSVYGCDSIEDLYLKVWPTFAQTDRRTICRGDTLRWIDGIDYTRVPASAPSVVTPSVHGCDSSVVLRLTVRENSVGYDRAEVIENNLTAFRYNGASFTHEVSDTVFHLANRAGCDSALHFSLRICRNRDTSFSRDVCDNAYPLHWDGETFFAAESRTYTILTRCGADSTIRLTLVERATYWKDYEDTICDNQSVVHSGRTFTTEGDYDITLQSRYGCDSMEFVHLKVWPTYDFANAPSICQGESFRWIDGVEYSAEVSPDPVMHYTTVHGCDSSYTLRLVVRDTSVQYVSRTVSENNLPTFRFNGASFAGDVADTVFRLTNTEGCDSVLHFSLHVGRNRDTTLYRSVCNNRFPYYYNGRYFYSAGTHTFSLRTRDGADSTITIELTSLPTYSIVYRDTLCRGESHHRWEELFGTGSGNGARHSLRTAAGCDSIESLSLTFNPVYNKSDRHTICRGDTLHWIDGEVYSEVPSPAPSVSYTSVQGCDSTITLDLQINDETQTERPVFACDSYTYGDSTYRESTIIETRDENLSLCGTVTRLILTVRRSTTGVDVQNRCDSYNWHGTLYTRSTNTPTYRLRNSQGCDSTVTLNLTIRRSTTGVDVQKHCDSYRWPYDNLTYTLQSNGKITYRKNYSTYTYSRYSPPTGKTRNVAGCDSTVSLILTLNRSTSSSETLTACDTLTWRGRKYTSTTDTYYDTVNAAGCRHRNNVTLVVNKSSRNTIRYTACDFFTYRDTTFRRSGTTVFRNLTNEYGCNYTETLVLTINPSTSSVVNVTACDSYTWHNRRYTASTNSPTYHSTNYYGCSHTDYLHLTINRSTTTTYYDTICDNQVYQRSGESYNTTGNYNIELEGANGCDSVEVIHLKVWPTYGGYDDHWLCRGNTLRWIDGQDYSDVVNPWPSDILASVRGCDSVVTLRLHMTGVTEAFDSVVVAENNLPSFRYNGASFASDVEDTVFRLTNRGGCDSLLHFRLRVCRNRDTVLYRQVCDNAYPFTIHNRPYYSAGTRTYTIATRCGADSNITLHLAENPTYRMAYFDTICDNQSFSQSGQTYNRAGTYRVNLRSSKGCDSTEYIHLKVWRTYAHSDPHSICRGDTLHWAENGESYTDIPQPAPVVAYLSRRGCDSTVSLALNIRELSYETVRELVTENDLPAYRYNGVAFDTDMADTVFMFTNAVRCDSVVHFSLHVARNRDTTLHLAICPGRTTVLEVNGEPKRFRTEGSSTFDLLTTEGADSTIYVYTTMYAHANIMLYDTICDEIQSGLGSSEIVRQRRETGQTVHGCDSITITRTTVRPIDVRHVTEVVPENDMPHSFLTATFFTEVTDSIFQLTNMWECDSLIHYTLLVCPNRDTTLYDTVCDTELPVVWNGVSFSHTDDRHTIIPTHCGADSSITMHLYVKHSSRADDVVEACDGYTWHGRQFDTANYSDTVHHLNAVGCDSLTTLRLTMHYSISFTYHDTICDNQTFSQSGQTLADEGLHTVQLRTIHSCDSTEYIHLKVWPTFAHSDPQSICRGDTLAWQDGHRYTDIVAPAPQVMYASQHGCDSTVALALQVRKLSYTWARDTVTQNNLAAFRYNGASFAGDVEDTIFLFTNAVGCDSVVHYSLYLCRNRDTNLYSVICDNQYPHLWNGQRFEARGAQSYTISTFCGADSAITLHLDEYPTYRIAYYDTICDNQTFSQSGQTFATEGLHTVPLSTIHSCDSLEEIHLKVWPTYRHNDPQSICHRDTLWWQDGLAHTEVENPVPEVMYASRYGCDSLVRLALEVRPISYAWVRDTVTENNLPLFRYNGARFATDVEDTLFLLTNAVDCDSFLHYSLFVCRNVDSSASITICDNYFPFHWNDGDFLHADTLTLHRTNRCGADSTVHLRVDEYPTYLYTHYDTICDNQVSYLDDQHYNTPGDHDHNLRTIHNCDSVERLTLTVYPTWRDTDFITVCRGERMIWIDGHNYSHWQLVNPQVLLTSSHGCDSLRTLMLDVTLLPGVNMRISPEHPTWDNPEVLLSDISHNSTRRRWYVDGRLVDTNATFRHHFEESDMDAVVSLVASIAGGCSDSISLPIHFNRASLYVPNIFTPDRLDNNVVRISGEDIDQMECYVYDRRGRFIFKFESMDDTWDGTSHGVRCPQGAYTYIVRYTTVHDPKSWLKKVGTIVLLR